jgi:purine-binding chemotaxis protein CheW
MADAGERLLTFRVGEEQFGVPASLVREVSRLPRVTRVPHAPEGLIGLGNFRGAVLPLLSFAALTDRPTGRERRAILLDSAHPIALMVEDVTGLRDDGGVPAIDVELLASSRFASAAAPRVRAASVGERSTKEIAEAEVPLVAFMVAGQEFALPIGSVDEIVRLPDTVALLPKSDDAVAGSIAVRDTLLPLLSLAVLLGLPMSERSRQARVVVVRIGSHRVGLIVDAMRAVLRVPEARIDPVPAVLARGLSEARIQAVCRLDGGRRLVSVLAAEHLVREDLTARLLETGGTERAMTEGTKIEASAQFLIFRIGGSDFALPIEAVIEVTALPPRLGRLPKAPAFVQGVMPLRGTVVPVIDQTLRFTGAAAEGARRRVIVVRIGELVAGFVVDAVAQVRRIALDDIRPAPALGEEATALIEQVAVDGADGIVLIVSPQELLDRAEREMLDGVNAKAARAS